jgi:uncharacterized protein (DUF4415 family)
MSGLPRTPGEVKIVLPPMAEPPTVEGATDDVPPAKKPRLPPGTKRTSTLAQLQDRARKATAKARQRKPTVTIAMDEAVYEALIDLAETYNTRITEVARQCLDDGIRKYKDFNSPHSQSPFRSTSVMRAYPNLLDPTDLANHPRNGQREDARERRAIAADELTGPITGYDETVAAETARAAASLGSAFLPQGGPPATTLGELAFDPLAPVLEEALEDRLRETALATDDGVV